jgi:tetratricopeptide (TPR) repeat protein
MSKKNKESAPEQLENVESALSRTEQFIENNQKTITTVVFVILIIVGGYLLFQRYYMTPLEQEAKQQMFRAEQYFAQDSFNLALHGDGNYLGFLDIVDEYGMTKSANLAKYYSGISYLQLGKYENAIDYLNDFSVDDKIIEPQKYGALGDAYMEKGNLDEALDYYEKAMNANDNQFSTPYFMEKAAFVYEEKGNYDDAIELYKKIKQKYPESPQSEQADKNIARLKVITSSK